MAFGLLSAAPMMATAADLKVGMVTDSGSIDDKSFNQGTWEGIKKAVKDLGVKSKYLKPGGTTEADYVKEISNLNDAGYGLIVTPGFKFESAIFVARDKYPKTKFVLIDGSPLFLSFMRANKDSAERIRRLIEQVTGEKYALGPYEKKKSAAGTMDEKAEETFRMLRENGVPVEFK